MGNCLSFSCPSTISKKSKQLPIETTFKLPSPIPVFPPGGRRGFASGIIDLGGGLKVCQVSTFNKIWATHEEGPDNLGATFFEPSPIPEGYFMLGCYCQPNNKPLFGRVLVGKGADSTTLQEPVDYTLVWSSQSLKIKQDGFGYIWLPTPPDGYKAVGLVVTVTPDKPPLDKIRCVNSDLTEECEIDTWIWGDGDGAFNVLNPIPSHRGVLALGVPVGSFVAQLQQQKEEEQESGSILGPSTFPSPLACLKNITTPGNLHSSMPTLPQINALVQAYSPWIYFHPDEKYLPSSVLWFFENGAVLYKKESPSDPIKIDSEGWNLPQGGSNDGAYWLDLPVDESSKEFVKKGNLQSAEAYLHVKPMFGSTFTDIAIWLFCPFNGAVKAKVEFINIALGKIGEHVGDWEHVTLRISNFNGELMGVFFSEHSGGTWVNAYDLEFQSGNKPVAYASLHGHAFYPKPGLVLQGSGGIGIRNDTAKSEFVMDTGVKFAIVGAEFLGSGPGTSIVEIPPWISYYRKWGPKISYDLAAEIKKVEKVLPGKLKSAFTSFVKSLPDEILGEEGPTGPKMKKNWNGDES